MATDPIDTILAELTAWAGTATRTPRGNTEDMGLLLRLLRDHVGVADPSGLRPGDLGELLLEVYPRKVTAVREQDVADVIPTVRELLAFLADTGRTPAKKIKQLEREVDRAEPRFADAVMNPANWGPARAITQAMAADGIDLTDSAATQRWIESYNAELGTNPFGEPDVFGPDDDDDDDNVVDLKNAFDLPDSLPPLRLPPTDELAQAARGARLLDQLKRLALWVDERRPVITNDELAAADSVDAARTLGIEVPDRPQDSAALPGTPTPPAVRRMTDLPGLARVWRLAEQLEFVALGERFATTGPGVEYWPDSDDDEVLDIWQTALAIVLDTDEANRDGLDFAGAGVVVAIMLFLAGGDGIPLADLNEVIQESATADLGPVAAGKAWQEWVKAHGKPADVLLGRLAELDAVEVRDGIARLTPLARYALRLQFVDAGVEVPLLPPVEDMTAADLMTLAEAATQDELAAESAAWLAARDPDQAVDELLAIAVTAGPMERLVAVSVAARIAAQTQARWRQALDEPHLRPYAKLTLAQLAGIEPPDAPPELVPSPADLAWLLTDTLASLANALTPEDLAGQLRDAVPTGQEQQMFEHMWRLEHPQVHDVLMLLGTHHPDTKIAKAARRAAFKAQSRGAQSQP